MNRRNFIKTSGLSIGAFLFRDSIFGSFNVNPSQIISLPSSISTSINHKNVTLTRIGEGIWEYQSLVVELKNKADSLSISAEAPHASLSSITLHWEIPIKNSSLLLNDHWERSYGDLSWNQPKESEILPWYFFEYDHKSTNGFGVKTGARAFCYWQIINGNLNLTLDTRSGGIGVQLGQRKLEAAEIVVTKSNPSEPPFETGKRFTKMMCDNPRLPEEPVYGINDWYFSYGNNSAELILEHTNLLAPMTAGLDNRPFSVIDAGWFEGPYHSWGDMSMPNEKFGNMNALAEKINELGMRPGIWTRPLCARPNDRNSLLLPNIEGRELDRPVLDPSIPENLERVKSFIKLYKEWGFELIKFDYTSFDIFKRWGKEMVDKASITSDGWSMQDVSKTNAEIILNFYSAIREAAGDTYILSCNTFSHLSAGLFEVNRIGDDTSGIEWERTRKMGVNTLAFRGIQHNSFYSADADCVGLTENIPWHKNKQWMELVAKSGTPLFISAQPSATANEQKQKIKECFNIASQKLPLGEPLGWMTNPTPNEWKLNNEIESFRWQ